MITLLELLAVWDYTGKIWYKDMSEGTLRQLLHARVRSPHAKMLTSKVFLICQQSMDAKLPHKTVDLVTDIKQNWMYV